MQLYQKFKFDCSDQLKTFGMDVLSNEWDFKSLKIIRIDTNDSRLELLKKELQEKNFPSILSMSIFCRGPQDHQIIHIDTVDTNVISNGNFYIPLVNDGGKLVWFNKEKGFTRLLQTPSHLNSTKVATDVLMWQPYASLQDAVMGEYTENDPVIINTTFPHRAESTLHPRAVLVFRLQGNPNLFDLISR